MSHAGWAVSRRAALAALARGGAGIAASGALAACSLSLPSASGAPTPTPALSGAGTPTPTPRPTGVTLEPRAPTLPGRLLFVSDADIWLLERGQLHRITPDRISRQPAWSRDGKKVAHVKLATSGSDLWIMNPDGSGSEELTDNEFQPDPQQHFALRPIWWPDGTRLLYLSEERSQDTQLWQLSLANRRRTPFFAPLGDRQGGLDCPKLSPDGNVVAAASFQPGRGPSGRSQVWVYTLPNGAPRQLTTTPDGAYDPDWSPDGRHIAYTVRTGVRHDIWIMRADGSGQRQVTTAGACRAPAWSPDGAWITYLSAQTGTFELWALPTPSDDLATLPASAATPAAPLLPTSAFRQITRGALSEASSGIAWT